MEANIVFKKKEDSDLTLDDLETGVAQEYDKINLNDSLDYIGPADLMPKLFMIKSKLKAEGIIVIQSFDLYELCYGVVDDKIPTVEFNNILENRKQVLCIPDVLFVLDKLGYKVLKKDIDGFKFLIEGKNGI